MYNEEPPEFRHTRESGNQANSVLNKPGFPPARE
jgi:hypothetical protein